MKKIIARNLDLTVKYDLIDKRYIPIIDSIGIVCANCGKLISNIATISNDGKLYDIGFDCLDTILLNNMILDEKDLESYNHYKGHIKSYIKHSKDIGLIVNEFNSTHIIKIEFIEFSVSDFKKFNRIGKNAYLTYYYVYENGKRYNSNIRVKNDINIDDFINTFRVINKNISIILK